MDAVRFGRALGFGARQAAKTVVRAVDAARAESPSTRPASPPAPLCANDSVPATPRVTTAVPPISPPANRPIRPSTLLVPIQHTPQITSSSTGGAREAFSRFRASAVEPAVRLSSVLWLEVTGVFFGLFALACGSALWRLRRELRPAFTHPVAHATVVAAAAIFALFAYFCVSSFVRAHRRQRRRG